MSSPPPADARTSASTARNRGPILDILGRCLPPSGLVLEVAAGAGEQAAFNAAALPGLEWLPTDDDPEALISIAAWRRHAAPGNLRPPLRLDAARPDTWPIDRADAVVAINMIHIAPWAAAQGLMIGAGRLLPTSGVLFLYGPYLEHDMATAPSNLEFDISLKSRNSAWGLRHLDDVVDLAAEQGLVLSERVVMPANNLALIFRKS